MLAEQRFEVILAELSGSRAASVTRLCQLTGASEATIRRDLTVLSRQGRLNKVHGGAVLAGGTFQGEEPDVTTKTLLRREEKDRIARYAAGLISNDDVVYLDAGTTTVRMVEHLKGSGATFVTNGIACAQRLMELGLRGYVLGGFLKPGTWAVVGTGALEELGGYNFTKAAGPPSRPISPLYWRTAASLSWCPPSRCSRWRRPPSLPSACPTLAIWNTR